MRTEPPALLPLLRSRVQGDLLALLYLHPDQECSLTEVAQAIEASVKAVHVEATRLVTAGLIKDNRRGRPGVRQAFIYLAKATLIIDVAAGALDGMSPF